MKCASYSQSIVGNVVCSLTARYLGCFYISSQMLQESVNFYLFIYLLSERSIILIF